MPTTHRAIEHLNTSSARLEGIQPNDINKVWPRVRPLLDKALSRFYYEMSCDDIFRALIAEEMQLWVVLEKEIWAAVVTQIEQRLKEKTLIVLAAGGERLSEWLNIIQVFEEYAKQNSCGAVEIVGRPGWQRIYKDYHLKMVTMRKEIDGR